LADGSDRIGSESRRCDHRTARRAGRNRADPAGGI